VINGIEVLRIAISCSDVDGLSSYITVCDLSTYKLSRKYDLFIITIVQKMWFIQRTNCPENMIYSS
jgi:hypothetical protein